MSESENGLAQDELDELLRIHDLIADGDKTGTALVDELENAILDSGKLSLAQWRQLRDKLKAIERLVPHIDLIIELRERRGVRT